MDFIKSFKFAFCKLNFHNSSWWRINLQIHVLSKTDLRFVNISFQVLTRRLPYCVAFKLHCDVCGYSADVDECATNSHSCNENAACSNSVGSYNCTCITGFIGDGFNCSGELIQHAEMQANLRTVWVKKIIPSLRFSNFFPTRLRIFNQDLHTYYTFILTLICKILLNCFQHWQSYVVLSAATQWIFIFHKRSITSFTIGR